jgi:hypothetical protein
MLLVLAIVGGGVSVKAAITLPPTEWRCKWSGNLLASDDYEGDVTVAMVDGGSGWCWPNRSSTDTYDIVSLSSPTVYEIFPWTPAGMPDPVFSIRRRLDGTVLTFKQVWDLGVPVDRKSSWAFTVYWDGRNHRAIGAGQTDLYPIPWWNYENPIFSPFYVRSNFAWKFVAV